MRLQLLEYKLDLPATGVDLGNRLGLNHVRRNIRLVSEEAEVEDHQPIAKSCPHAQAVMVVRGHPKFHSCVC